MEQAVPIARGGQGKQPLATGIHVRPPVQTTCGNTRERENGAGWTAWDWRGRPSLQKTQLWTGTCSICRGTARDEEC